MDELISREKALKALEEANLTVKGLRFGKTILSEYSKQIREGYIDIVRNISLEDAKITKYGEWITVGKTSYGSPIRECSNCKKQRTSTAKTAYCPDCGAKMRRSDDSILGQTSF